MKRSHLILAATGLVMGLVAGEEGQAPAKPERTPEVKEARVRAQLLHETIHGSLQVMHRDFFREGDRLRIPSSSMEDVFRELKRSWNVEVAWMSVNAKAMNVDHRPEGAFEESAVKELNAGKEMAETVEGDTYRYAGAISLGNECLKCHLPDRQNLDERKAAVLISMPLRSESIGPR
ncbi:c-type heme family protein [Luteolibacter luteus]|uniref:DUF3365 domain-containing protein n=1 Tax=Luteolibacter luteus TaxID=2728835 RepID=A0A858RP45_9BACT|nr:DUF3365 domain-containing protein [Luteolibacter luteus]QJE98284.1 DUF3365 domain-containing protein [Luteolibacter luteus]